MWHAFVLEFFFGEISQDVEIRVRPLMRNPAECGQSVCFGCDPDQELGAVVRGLPDAQAGMGQEKDNGWRTHLIWLMVSKIGPRTDHMIQARIRPSTTVSAGSINV